MKILLVHLSDIHIETSEDPILDRATKIIDAIKNIEPEITAVTFVLSGDITYSGSEEQYSLALKFVDALKSGLQKHLDPNCPVFFVAVSGNHDCDFSGATEARNALIGIICDSPMRLKDKSFIDICLGPQKNFFKFRDSIDTPPANTIKAVDNRIYIEYVIAIKEESVVFCCCNSAALSQFHEKPGSLAFPYNVIPANKIPVAVSIGVIHHPINWFEPTCAKKLRKRLEAVTDFIITGHEHELDKRAVLSKQADSTYIEGGVLQVTGDSSHSEFFAFLVDTTARKQRILSFSWNGECYEATNCEDPCQYHNWEDFSQNRYRLRTTFQLQTKFREFLDDVGVTLTHHSRGVLHLSDVFVYPDLRKINLVGDKSEESVPGEKVLRLINEKNCLFIVGDTLSGKTTLAKRLFCELLSAGSVPVFMDGPKFQASFESVDKLVEECFIENYGNAALTNYRQLDRARRVLLVDNYHKLKLTAKGKIDLIHKLRSHSFRVILFAHDLELTFQDLAEAGDSKAGELPFHHYSILPFSLVNRNRLVEKWLMLGSDAEEDVGKFVHNLDHLNRIIDSLVGKNYVPAYPSYILAVLQAAEAGTEIDLRGSTHGYLYELFIKTAIAKKVPAAAFNTYNVFLSHVAYWMFEQASKNIQRRDLLSIHGVLQHRTEVMPTFDRLVNQLLEMHLVVHQNDHFAFRHPYIYYYYLALYLRDRLPELELPDVVRKLAAQLFKEENANTLLFLSYLTKKRLLLDILVESAESQYRDAETACLETDVDFLNQLYSSVNTVQLPSGSIRDTRQAELQALDLARNDEIRFEEEARSQLEDGTSMLGRLNAALKTIQIVGQYLKNFPADLDRADKDRVITCCCNLGRRALADYIGLVRRNETEFLQEIVTLIGQKHPGMQVKTLRERAVSSVVGLCELASFGFVVRISNALGSRDLTTTYDRFFPDFNEPIMRLVYASLRLDHYDDYPETIIAHECDSLHKNPFAFRILRALVIRYLSLFPTDFRIKQELSERMKLEYQKVRLSSEKGQLIGE